MLRLAKKTTMCKNGILLTTKGSEMLAFADIEILKKAMHNSFEKSRVGILCVVCVCGTRMHTCFLFANAPFLRPRSG